MYRDGHNNALKITLLSVKHVYTLYNYLANVNRKADCCHHFAQSMVQ